MPLQLQEPVRIHALKCSAGFAGLYIDEVMQLQTTHPKHWNFRSCGTAQTPLEDMQGM